MGNGQPAAGCETRSWSGIDESSCTGGAPVKRIYVIGTADTKGEELSYLAERIASLGAAPVLVDVGPPVAVGLASAYHLPFCSDGGRQHFAIDQHTITHEPYGEALAAAPQAGERQHVGEVTATLRDVLADGQARLGVGIETALERLQLPFRIELAEDTRIGGPSAGMMVAVTVYDMLSEENLLAGRTVVGTGTLDPEGRVVTWTINRPDAGNKLRVQTCRELTDALQRFRLDPQLRAAVLTGAGDRFFCIGGEHEPVSGLDYSQVLPILDVYQAIDTIANWCHAEVTVSITCEQGPAAFKALSTENCGMSSPIDMHSLVWPC
jgi:hypothetical protein